MELIFPTIAGILSGVVAGLIPGIGITALMISVGLFFVADSPLVVLAYYIGLLCASQYVGSMLAISFGLPGESSSLPAVKEGYPLFQRGKGSLAIGTTAISSFFGSFISMALFFAILPVAEYLVYIWNTNMLVIIFSVAMLLTFYISDNKLWVSLIMAAIGVNLGMVGMNMTIGTNYMTFEQWWLYGGLPMIPVLMGCFVLPELWKAQFESKAEAKEIKFKLDVKDNFEHSRASWLVILVHSIVGFFCGLVPALTTKLASNLSYFLQKSKEVRYNNYTGPGNLKSLIAAETSNNAATFSVLLPLLFLGIPITTSEFILYDHIQDTTTGLNLEYILNNFDILLACFVATNFICLALAWPMANTCLAVYRLPANLLKLVTVFLVLFPIIYTGLLEEQLLFYVGTFILCSVIGMIFRRYDTMPIVFVFLISREFIEGFHRFYVINVL